MKRSALSLLKFFIGWPLTVVAFYYIYQMLRPELRNIGAHLAQINLPLLIIGIICFLAYYVLRSYAWQLIVTALGHPLSLRETFFLYSYSELKRYIPGNIWSFLSRTFLYTQRGIEKKKMVNALLIEAELVVICCLLLTLFCSTFLLQTVFQLPYATLLRSTLIFLSIVGVTVYVFQRQVSDRFGLGQIPFIRSLLANFSASENFAIACWSLASYLMFGIGYFFSMASVITIHPQQFVIVSALSVFSLLVGYLSFLTPTGLGVREGVLLVGLANFTTLGLASLATIFARLLLIVTEVITIALSYVLYRAKSTERFFSWIARHKHLLMVFSAIGVFSVYFVTVNVHRYDQYYTGRFDLGNMAQTVWNTANGNFFQMTDVSGTRSISRLAVHADFLLVLLAPFYFIWEDPRMLLIVQSIVVGCGAYYVFRLGQLLLKHNSLSAICAIVFLLNPSLQRAAIYDFHAVVLATTFLLGAVYYLLKKEYVWFVIMAVLAAITKEQVWIIIGLLGAIPFLFQKERLFGASLFVMSFLVGYLLIWHAIPNAYGKEHFALSYFSEESQSPTQLITDTLQHPQETWDLISGKERITYLKKLFVPVGYLPLFAPQWLLFTLPDLTINLLSKKAELHQIYYQYTAIITPFLFIASLFVMRFVLRLRPRGGAYAAGLYFLTVGLIGAYYYGPLPGTKEPNLDMFVKPLPERSVVDASLAAIPENAKVASTNNLGSHLSHREHIYTVPYGIDRAEYIALLLSDSTLKARPDVEQQLLTTLYTSGQFTRIVQSGNFLLFQRK